jgi:branched-chain amino acid transport system substrate-binding protein
MTDPEHSAEHARPEVDTLLPTRDRIGRRDLFRLGGVAGIAVAGGGLLASCSSSSSSSSAAANSASTPATSAGAAPATSITDLKNLLDFDPAYLGTGQTYTLGGILPLSGAGSYYGQVMSHGIQVAVQQVKQLGGPTFLTNLKDNQSGDAVAGITALRELAGSSTQLMYSTYQADNHALLPGIQSDKIFSLEIGQQDLSSSVSGIPYYWSAVETLSGSVPLMFKYMSVAHPSVKRLYVVAVNYGPAIMNPFLEGMKSAAAVIGATVVGSSYVPPGTTDFSSLIGEMSRAQFDGVINYIQPGAGLFMRSFVQAGLSQPNFTVTVLPSDAAAGGAAMNGYTVAGLQFDPASTLLNPLAIFFRNGYNANFGAKPLYPEGYAAGAYDATFQFWQLIQAALKAKMPITGTTLNSLASSITVKSVFGGTPSSIGTWSWGANHFPAGEEIAVYVVDDNANGMKQVAIASGNGVSGFQLV